MDWTSQRMRRSSAIAQAATEPRHVLLILEDFDELRALLARHFVERGYEVFSSSTLRDALAIAWEEAPQMIIIDYSLRGEDAMHVIERLHNAQPLSQIVLAACPPEVEVEEQAIAAGASRVWLRSLPD
ncbi:MAG: response regulator [Bacteroidota bacterium]|nr:response regulator [Bacteroidota bacterium]MDP4232460.1 response regulator [Bacteroidota bacterium]MDP4241596.1 response regulator [Bacteroidota bacterium]MDP4286340.1 response regulator [Bacteroidota bacterium]